MVKSLLLVALGGAAGSVARYVISVVMIAHVAAAQVFPLGTFTVNLTGSLILGFLAGWGKQWTIALLSIGFCGGFTTFSTFSLEVFNIMRAGNIKLATVYILASVIVCALAVWLGFYLGMKLNRV